MLNLENPCAQSYFKSLSDVSFRQQGVLTFGSLKAFLSALSMARTTIYPG